MRQLFLVFLIFNFDGSGYYGKTSLNIITTLMMLKLEEANCTTDHGN
jgi:hypothetical protein